MSFFFPNHCSMCDWISFYGHMMMLFRYLSDVYLIIIVLYVVIMVWGSITCFAGLLEREEQEEDWRESLDQPSVYQVWIFLIYETCCYMLAEHYTSTLQPQYVDGLLNPSHRTLSFTTELATSLGRALSVWGFSWFISAFCIVSGPSFHLGTPYRSDRTPPLPS